MSIIKVDYGSLGGGIDPTVYRTDVGKNTAIPVTNGNYYVISVLVYDNGTIAVSGCDILCNATADTGDARYKTGMVMIKATSDSITVTMPTGNSYGDFVIFEM